MGPLGGYLVDRFGPRRMISIGAIVMGVGFLLMSQVNSLLMFYVVFLGVISVGMSIGIRVPAPGGPCQLVRQKRGIAIGIALTGSGLGGLFIPFLGLLIVNYGWRRTAIVAGIAVWVLALPLAMVMRTRPEDYGMLPDGERPSERQTAPAVASSADGSSAARATPEHLEGDYTLRSALRAAGVLVPGYRLWTTAVRGWCHLPARGAFHGRYRTEPRGCVVHPCGDYIDQCHRPAGLWMDGGPLPASLHHGRQHDDGGRRRPHPE